ncbi:MAG TPA: NB-ARC domain-containing protein, partial [Polyangiales bacterium]|nr:NB-ARC domain-containing protein [Polyangiales bacterium]
MSYEGGPQQPKRGCVFVSYSHADKVWLERLRIILKPYPVYEQLWIDPYIPVGERWERAIEAALQRAEVGLLLLSTDFLASDFILDKELPALRQASDAQGLRMFCVPVGATGAMPRRRFALDGYQWARSPDSPLDLLEPAQWKAALVQMAEALQALWDASASQDMPAVDGAGAHDQRAQAAVFARAQSLEPLERSASERARLHGVPALPPHFVVREQELRGLKRAVLDLQQPRFGISGAASGTKAGLHGQGGIGKTVLATALVHDDEVRATFSDGIYWLTLGQEPNLVALLGELATMFGLPDEQRDLGGLTQALRGALREQRCLLVLDDVWQPGHAQAFDVLGGAGRTLITSRDELLLGQLGAATRRIEAMAKGAARSLLAQWANQDVASLPALADEIAQRCGYLPLALALSGAQVREGCSWPDLLQALRKGDLEFLDHPHGSVFKSLSASVEALPEDERARYGQLAIFPEDTPVP